ncbi:MAG: HDIG domain-containing protein [Syntrophomonadaceae bacterium]|nr:HDIG domain-containing protein [Syntrophomonadaceae bacterium]
MNLKNMLREMLVPLVRTWRSLSARRFMWALVFFLATMLILGADLMPRNIKLEAGQPSPKTFSAPKSITFASEVLTEAARQEAARQVKPAYRVDDQVLLEVEGALRSYFGRILEITAAGDEASHKLNNLRQLLPSLTAREAATAIQAEPVDINALEMNAIQLLRQNMGLGIQREAVDSSRQKMLQEADRLPNNPSLAPLLKAVLQQVEIQPNLVYDPVATARNIELAQNAVVHQHVSVKANQVIVREGDVVTEVQIETLQQLGLLRTQAPYLPLFGLALLILISYGLIFFFIYQHQRVIFNHETHFILLGMLMVTTLVFTKGFYAINLGGGAAAMVTGYLAPVAAGSMLIAILLDKKLAMFCTIIMAIFTGIVTGGQLSFTVVAVVGGLVGVYCVSKLSQRSDLAKSSLYIALANVITITAMGLLDAVPLTTVSLAVLMGIINGVLSAILTIGSLPFLETAFGITTSVKLLELSNPNQPLLKRLLVEAPGTYHHSIMVGNLAEAAADAVGTDSLLARIGAYYHDIGKLKRPYFFIENQFTAENPHEKLSPSLSTLIITSHIKDGLEMAKNHRLPQVILDIIEQHHGTSLISYFYHKAVEHDRAGSVAESDYRYESPKPGSKEAAIVMLADSVEAAVRSMQKPTPGRMEGLVRRIIKDKLDDGQLEGSELTYRELDKIAQSFVRVLSGIFHNRIEYPDSVLKELERRRNKDVAIRAKSAG